MDVFFAGLYEYVIKPNEIFILLLLLGAEHQEQEQSKSQVKKLVLLKKIFFAPNLVKMF